MSSSILLLSEKRKLFELITNQKSKLESIDYSSKLMEYEEESLEKQIQDRLDKITQLKSTIQKNDYSVTNTYSEITTKQLPARKLFIIIGVL